jgi:ATP/maltotriose-dependent transcriptional regulator MalT
MEMEKMMERLIARKEAKMDLNQKKAEADWDELKAIMKAFHEKMDSNQAMAAKQEKMLAKMKANQARMAGKMDANHRKIDSNQEKAEASMPKIEEKMDDYHKKRMAMLDAHHKHNGLSSTDGG